MSKTTTRYTCTECQYVAAAYMGKCPRCDAWGSMTETRQAKAPTATDLAQPSGRFQVLRERLSASNDPTAPPQRAGTSDSHHPQALATITTEASQRDTTGYAELDRVLGGGLLQGSYVLIGGDPGIGKSTLLLQVAAQLPVLNSAHHPEAATATVLYVAGEESPQQIKQRAERLSLSHANILLTTQTQIEALVEQIQTLRPRWVIIDSIQSLYSPHVSSTPGSVSQLKECASVLMQVAKTTQTTILLIGHVTKEGGVAGPKVLEHTVDTVLYLEGERYQNLRLLRAVKNRFGNQQELGVFEMQGGGMVEVPNPSARFLSLSGNAEPQPGSVITATVEGSRPLLVEIQALVGQTVYPNPRRLANGFENNRLHQIIAVLERRLGLDVTRQDVYVNVVGGFTIDEPAADLAIALAIIGSHTNQPMPGQTVVFGELGLTGEIRPVPHTAWRMQEAAKIGVQRMIAPEAGCPEPAERPTGVSVLTVPHLMNAITQAFPQRV